MEEHQTRTASRVKRSESVGYENGDSCQDGSDDEGEGHIREGNHHHHSRRARKRRGWYGVHKGRSAGVFETWAQVWPLVKGYKGAIHRRFDDYESAWRFSIAGPGATVIGRTSAARQNRPESWACRSMWGPIVLRKEERMGVLRHDPSVGASGQRPPGHEGKGEGGRGKPAGGKESRRGGPREEDTPPQDTDILVRNGPTPRPGSADSGLCSAEAPRRGVTHPPARDGNGGADGVEVVALSDSRNSHTKVVVAYRGAAASGPPNEGHVFEVQGRPGSESGSTRRRAQLYAIVCALELVQPDVGRKRVWSASREAIDCLRRYLDGWKTRGMRMYDGRPVADADLILRIDDWLARHPGHSLALLLPGRGGGGPGTGGCPLSYDEVVAANDSTW